MIWKDHEVKWIVSSKYVFDQIKKAISEAPTLASRDCTKPFSIFSFAYETTLVVVLLQKNEYSHDQPIAFLSKVTRDVKLKYDIIEKQAYALIQALKSFRMYVLHSPNAPYVPNSVVNFFLTQPGRWEGRYMDHSNTGVWSNTQNHKASKGSRIS